MPCPSSGARKPSGWCGWPRPATAGDRGRRPPTWRFTSIRRHDAGHGARRLVVAETLEGAAGAFGADLIVTGAYGYSRLREWFFGGVTRDR